MTLDPLEIQALLVRQGPQEIQEIQVLLVTLDPLEIQALLVRQGAQGPQEIQVLLGTVVLQALPVTREPQEVQVLPAKLETLEIQATLVYLVTPGYRPYRWYWSHWRNRSHW